MKRAILLLSFLLCTTIVFTQGENEFGLILKAGNFVMPREGFWYGGYAAADYKLKPGLALGAGGFSRFALSRSFSISAELLLYYTQYERLDDGEGDTFTLTVPPSNKFVSKSYFSMYSAVVPVKLNFQPDFCPKTWLSAGIAQGFTFLSYLEKVRRDGTGTPVVQNKKPVNYRNPNRRDARLQWLFTAGIQHRMNENFSLGLDFTGTFNRNSIVTKASEVYDASYSLLWMKSLEFAVYYQLSCKTQP